MEMRRCTLGTLSSNRFVVIGVGVNFNKFHTFRRVLLCYLRIRLTIVRREKMKA